MIFSVQFLKFLVVGVLNTLFGYSIFVSFVLANVPPGLALLLTYVVGILFNFLTTRRFVFSQSSDASLLRFVGAYVVIYFVNLSLYKLIETASFTSLVTQALCLPVVAVFSFFIFKLQVFRESP